MCAALWRQLSGGKGPDFSDAAFRAIIKTEYGLTLEELAPAESRPSAIRHPTWPWLLVVIGGCFFLLVVGLWLLRRPL